MVTMGILLIIDDDVYVCICKVYYYDFKEYTQQTCVYDSHFTTLEKSDSCVSIIDNISYSPICVLEEKDRKRKAALKNMLRILFDGNCIVEYAFKVTANDFSYFK